MARSPVPPVSARGCARRGHRSPGALTVAALLIAAAFAPAAAQEPDDPLVGDRPDFTESAITVTPGRVQLEAGGTFTDAGEAEATELGEVLVRIGLASRVELRIGLGSYARVDPPGGRDDSGFTDTSVGVKLALGTTGGWTTALLAGTSLPTGSTELGASDPEPALVFAAQRDLTETVSLVVNLGHARPTAGDERFAVWSASAAIGVPVGADTGAFFELFGIVPEDVGGAETYYFDAGVTRALGPDLQLDLRAGLGLNSAADDFFAGVGVIWRR